MFVSNITFINIKYYSGFIIFAKGNKELIFRY